MLVWTKRAHSSRAEALHSSLIGLPGLQPVITAVPGRQTARLDVYCDSSVSASALRAVLGGAVRRLRNQNWAALSPPPAPIRIRDCLVIVGARTQAEISRARKKYPGREIIAVPPDMAFGTGHHATTATMLRFLADIAECWNRKGRKWSVIDLGCGSGILAIAAAKLGAASVRGFDLDSQAVRIARENLKRNSVRGAVFDVADVLAWKAEGRYDCVVANMFSELLVAAFANIVRAIKRDGVVMISGILATQASSCLSAGRKAGLRFDRIVRHGRWISALGRLKKSA